MKSKTIKPWMIPAAAAVPIFVLAVLLIVAALTSDGTHYFLPSLQYGARPQTAGFELFGISLYTLMQIIGVALGFYTIIKYHAIFNVSIKQAILITAIFDIQAVISFKLLYAVQICMRSGDFSHWDFGGASVYGAFFGMILVGVLLFNIQKSKQKSHKRSRICEKLTVVGKNAIL